MPFPRGPGRGPQTVRVRATVFAVGRRAYVVAPAARGTMVTLADGEGRPHASIADGAAVDIVAWRPGGRGEAHYRVQSVDGGVEGWLASANLRRDAAAAQDVPAHTPRGFTHRLLDQLAGAPTTVTVAAYVGDDPWRANDLIGPAGAAAKRFRDGTAAEQAEALSGDGPSRFIDADARGFRVRATTPGHHEHVEQVHDPAAGAAADFFGSSPTQLETGPEHTGSGRHYQTNLFTELTAAGGRHTWREATCYSHDGDGRTFGVSSSMARVTGTDDADARQHGLYARFDLARPSPNGFRPLSVTLRGAERDSVCALLVQVCGRIAGREQLAQVTLRAFGSTIDVRLVSPAPGCGEHETSG